MCHRILLSVQDGRIRPARPDRSKFLIQSSQGFLHFFFCFFQLFFHIHNPFCQKITILFREDQRSNLVAADGLNDILRVRQIKDQKREAVVLAHGSGGGIHYSQIFG